nr:MAG TPA_asm: hypothetical protein [Caudoviricetes sp.]
MFPSLVDLIIAHQVGIVKREFHLFLKFFRISDCDANLTAIGLSLTVPS